MFCIRNDPGNYIYCDARLQTKYKLGVKQGISLWILPIKDAKWRCKNLYQNVLQWELCPDQRSHEMDSFLLQVNEALWNQHSKSKESHPSQLQQSHMNLTTPHLLPKTFKNRNPKSGEFHPSQLQQLCVNLAAPYFPPYFLSP